MLYTIGLFVATAVPLLIYYYITREHPDLVYFISDPLEFPDQNSERPGTLFQQIDIRNAGTKRASDITIKIPQTVADVKLTPLTASDDWNQKTTESGREIFYPAIPPEQAIRLTVSSQLTPLSSNSLEIIHADGVARQNLVGGTRWPQIFWATYLVGIVGYFLVIFVGLARDHLLWRAESEPKKVLFSGMPFYCSESAWKKVRDKAVDYTFSRKYGTPMYRPSDRPLYQWVFQDTRPEEIDRDTWTELQRRGAKELITDLLQCATALYKEDEIIELLSYERPQCVSSSEWDGLRQKISDEYVALRLARGFGIAATESEVRKHVPTELTKDASDRLGKELALRYEAALITEVSYAHNGYISYLSKRDLEPLAESSRRSLNFLAYQLDLSRFSNLFYKKSAQEFLGASRPDWMNRDDYDRLRELAEFVLNMNARESEVSKKEGELTKNALELAGLKKKVTAQLELINRVLEKPSEIDRIEEYDNPFSPGNFANLQRVAKALNSSESKRKPTALKSGEHE